MIDEPTTLTHQQRCGQNIVRRRLRLRLTQLTVAKAAKTTQQTISRIEAGEQAPSDRLKVRIAAALGVAAVDLFPYEDEGE